MLVWLVATALAADFGATLDGRPWAPRTVLAAPVPSHPWNWSLFVSDGKFTCDDLASGRTSRRVSATTKTVNGASTTTRTVEGAAKDTRFTVMFASTKAGTPAVRVAPSGKLGREIALDRATVTVVSVAEGGGTVAVDWKGPAFEANGDLAFTACVPLGERPLPAWPADAREHAIVNAALFPGGADTTMTVTMALPDWRYEPPSAEVQPEARYVAPDGITRLALSLEPAPTDFAKEIGELVGAELAVYRIGGAKVRRDEPLAGARVYEVEQGGARQLVVLRWEPGWPYLVRCTVVSDADGAAAVFDEAEASCTAITRRSGEASAPR